MGDLRGPAVTTVMLLVAMGASILLWLAAAHLLTSDGALGFYLPVSDGYHYWSCANQFIDHAANDTWCHRRPLYSLFLAGVSLVTGRSLGGVHLLQAAALGAAAYCCLRGMNRWWGILPTFLGLLLLINLGVALAIGETLSEVLGGPLGLVAAAILLRSAEDKNVNLAALGLFVVSIGLSVRPGAMFALPFVWAWIVYIAPPGRSRYRAAFVAAGAVLLGMVPDLLATMAVHATAAESNGNFSMTLYGLSAGSNWTAVRVDHPELYGDSPEHYRAIYALALDNIRHHPGVFVGTLFQNLWLYMSSIFKFKGLFKALGLPLWAGGIAGAAFYLAALATSVWCARRSAGLALVAACALGELLSSPVVFGDAGVRALAVTAPLAQACLLAAFAAECLRFLSHGPAARHLRWAISLSMPGPARSPALSIGLAIAFALLTLLPLTPIRSWAAPSQTAPAAACPAGQIASTVRIGRGGGIMRLEAANAHFHLWPDVSNPQRIRVTDRNGKMLALEPMQLILADPITPAATPTLAFLAPSSVRVPRHGRLHVCAREKAAREIGGVIFRPLASFTPAH